MNPFRHLAIRTVFLQPGELFVDEQPAVVQTILGSCVAVTMFCTRGKFGGICHALLPSGATDSPTRYVEGAIRLLVDKMLQHGSRINWLESKLFGGARVLTTTNSQRPTVGDQNVACATELLHRLKLPLAAVDTGGVRGRRLYFNSGSGEVYLRKVRNSSLDGRCAAR